jgi:hypothetical protein
MQAIAAIAAAVVVVDAGRQDIDVVADQPGWVDVGALAEFPAGSATEVGEHRGERPFSRYVIPCYGEFMTTT